MNSCNEDEALQNIFTDENNTLTEEYFNLLYDTGYTKPPTSIKLEDREELEHILKKYYCLVKVKAFIDEFIEGLQSLLIQLCQKIPGNNGVLLC